MKPTILYKGSDIVAVFKPAGLVVHSDGKTAEPTLAEWAVKHFPEMKEVGEPGRTTSGMIVPRPGIVHRLDRETSGVMLLARTSAAFEMLKKQFQEHTIAKEYHAFAYGRMKDDRGRIDRPIGRSASDFRKWSAQRGAKGDMRDAVTEYEVDIRGKAGREEYTFVRIFPKTGRTHQIRVHFKAINYPLVADSLYAPGRTNNLGFERLALHSYKITFTDCAGILQEVVAPYPEDFTHAQAVLQK